MKLTPLNGPTTVQTTNTTADSAKARAVAAFNDPGKVNAVRQVLTGQAQAQMGQPPPQAQEIPVANPNNISAEELSAIKAPTQEAAPLEASDTAANTEATESQEIREQAKADPETERRFRQLEQAARRERAKIQQERQKLNERESEIKAREQALETKSQPQDLSQYVSKARLKQEALTVFEEEGLSWEELANQAMNRQPIDPSVKSTMSQLKQEIAELKTQLEAGQKAQVEEKTQAYQAAVKQIHRDASDLINSDPEFEMIKSTRGAVNDVVQLIEKNYQRNGVVMTIEEAAKAVEQHLLDEAVKTLEIKKIKKQLEAKNASPPKTETKIQEPKQTQSKTLTNNNSGTRPLTARERAIAAAEGRKNW